MMLTRRYKRVHRDKIQLFAEIIASEINTPVEKITKILEDYFAESNDEEVTVGYIVDLEEPFNLEELKEQAMRLSNMAVELEDCTILALRRYNRESWHTHHKEGKPCKAKIKPIYWHRIRSFCVQNNYH